ncbi:NUMOD4 motif-containing HNH endonuclease [Neobacillus sp. NPDC093127]|uniref:NUMOD4 motif-containing HNH endonuclease n=1 Tax=Neobacillus sp. NPDC093127 TaxID=3364296 RepID=UPI003819EC04
MSIGKVTTWKDIVGYEGLYQVSNQGDVKGLDRKGVDGRDLKGKVLKPKMNTCGYLQVNLCKNRIKKFLYVHRLVAKAFLNNPNGFSQVNHIDGVKTNNNLENLEWVSPTTNLKHAFSIGLKSNSGESHSQSKLTEKDVIDIYKRAHSGESQRVIAGNYGIVQQAVSDIKLQKSWSYLTKTIAI